MRFSLLLALGLSSPILAATFYSEQTSRYAKLLFGHNQTSAFSAAPQVVTTPLDNSPSMTLVGNGEKGDPCTANVHTEALPYLKEMNIYGWLEACEEAVAKIDK